MATMTMTMTMTKDGADGGHERVESALIEFSSDSEGMREAIVSLRMLAHAMLRLGWDGAFDAAKKLEQADRLLAVEMRECVNCDWTGYTDDCVHPKHVPEQLLCPLCHDTTHEIGAI